MNLISVFFLLLQFEQSVLRLAAMQTTMKTLLLSISMALQLDAAEATS